MLMVSLLLLTLMSALRASGALICVFFQSTLKSLQRIDLTSASRYARRASTVRTWKVRMGITFLIENLSRTHLMSSSMRSMESALVLARMQAMGGYVPRGTGAHH
jgi:hypothetical protein